MPIIDRRTCRCSTHSLDHQTSRIVACAKGVEPMHETAAEEVEQVYAARSEIGLSSACSLPETGAMRKLIFAFLANHSISKFLWRMIILQRTVRMNHAVLPRGLQKTRNKYQLRTGPARPKPRSSLQSAQLPEKIGMPEGEYDIASSSLQLAHAKERALQFGTRQHCEVFRVRPNRV
jgi:hypothetical protein